MKVFVTGATGFVGSAVVRELLDNGHTVVGLVRSADSADRLRAAGAVPLAGDLGSPDTLTAGAASADAVIHTGFLHDFSRFAAACAMDAAAIETLGAALAGTDKPLVVTSGLAGLRTADRVAVESDPASPPSAAYPRASDAATRTLAARGIAASVMRLPPSVHGAGDHGFVLILIDIARRTGRSAFVEKGDNAWPAVHVSDAARAFRLAIERGTGGATYHAVAEEAVPFRSIAEAIARGLDVPAVSLSADAAEGHFGWFAGFAGIDQPASSAMTRGTLGWRPTGPDLLADIAEAGYFAVAA
jgi:nucleoside-diphosphate-sugar epimerase